MKTKVDIIIKALNEEDRIRESIESALAALEDYDGRVILVDSISEDKTVEIAREYPIKILQIGSKSQRCCAVGVQVGYTYCTGDFIYILDGDMVLNKDFIKSALTYFSDPKVAAVGGMATIPLTNQESEERARKHMRWTLGEVDHMPEGGLYRKAALDDVGYFANPFLHANEEADIGYNLIYKGYKLLRIDHPMITHYMHGGNSVQIVFNRWKSKYLTGPGQILRCSLKTPKIFFMHLKRLKVEIVYIGYLLYTIIMPILSVLLTKYFFYAWLGFTVLFFSAYSAKKKFVVRNILFSLLYLTIYSAAIIRGFFFSGKAKYAKDFPYDTVKVIAE